MPQIKNIAKEINLLIEDIQKYNSYKQKLASVAADFKEKKITEEQYRQSLKGKTYKEWLDYYNSFINLSLDKISKAADNIISSLKSMQLADVIGVTKLQKARYKKELNIETEYLKNLMPGQEEQLLEKEYSVYEVNTIARLVNRFTENSTSKLIKRLPGYYDMLSHAIRTSDLKILSRSYANLMVFFPLLISIISLIVLPFIFSGGILLNIVKSVFISFFAGVFAVVLFYIYPLMNAISRQNKIKEDLPFALMHMSAVAGSGAQPIAMFNLLLSSHEYKGLEGEIKKIVNYVNLFGYNLSTALRAVALTTPSKDFRELLNGLVTTIEGGGSLKEYLIAKADESMTRYQLDRKKYVETVATYSDIYIGVGIAGPLLFFVTLAIIQGLGGALMGMSVATIATVGTYAFLPLLNIVFIIIISLLQPAEG